MLKRFFALGAALVCAAACLGCGSLSNADRAFVRGDNRVIPYRFTGGVFGSLTLDCTLYGYNCEQSIFESVLQDAQDLMTELDQEITTQRSPERDEAGNVQKDENGKIVYLPDAEQSTIWRFNHNVGGDEIVIEGETWRRYELGRHGFDMLSRAEKLNRETDGYFDPTVYSVLRLWGLQTGAWNSASAHEALPTPAEVKAAMVHVGVDKIRVGEDERGRYVAKRDEAVQLDLGAQAKGYAADRLAELVRTHAEIIGATINIAGNVYFVGGFPDVVSYRGAYYLKGMRDFVAAVTDPYSYSPLLGGEMQSPILGLAGRDISVVTSGDYVRRFYWFDGAYSYFPPVRDAEGKVAEYSYFCHIIDPLTGYPCNINPSYGFLPNLPYSNKVNPSSSDARVQYADQLTSVSVLGVSSEYADVYATALMLMGRTKGLVWMETHGVDALLLGCDGYYALRYGGAVETGDGFSWSGWNGKLIAADGYGITATEAA